VIQGSDAFGGPFALTTHLGEAVTDKDVITKPSLIYFGYTFCPDVCPFDNARNAAAVDLLAERGYDVQPVFITVDPERDTVEVMAEQVGYTHPDMLGLTGTPEQVDAAAKAYKAVYQKGADQGDGLYLVSHSAYTYLALPEVGVPVIFTTASDVGGGANEPVTEDVVADVTACVLDAV